MAQKVMGKQHQSVWIGRNRQPQQRKPGFRRSVRTVQNEPMAQTDLLPLKIIASIRKSMLAEQK